MVTNGTESTNGEDAKSSSNSVSGPSKNSEEKAKSQNTSSNTSKNSSAANSPKASLPRIVGGSAADQPMDSTEPLETDKKR